MTSFKLYDYQEKLVNQARHLFLNHQGVLIQSPPGSGKSVMIAEVVKKAIEKGGHILFIVHRRELIRQIEQTLKKHNVDLNHVDILSERKAKNRMEQLTPPTIILTDETHHSRAKTYTEIYDYFHKSLRLGFTATPWRANGKGFTDIYSKLVEGPSVEWLIQSERLADYDYKSIANIDMKKLKKSRGDYTKQSIDEALDKAIYGDIVENYLRFAKNRKTILYAHSVEKSQEFAAQFKREGIKSEHVDAKTDKYKREQIMEGFKKGDIKVLCNVDLISEGFDVPDCSCVILARPTDSLVLFMQQAMRSMRYQPNKRALIIDHVGNYMRHGLPDKHHDWQKYFKGFKKKKSKSNEDDINLTECPKCLAVFDSQMKQCPQCGYEQPTKSNESELKTVKAELTDIKPFKVDYTLQKYSKHNKQLSELETLEDYYLYAKANCYKETWIKFKYPPYRNVSYPQFYADLKPIKQKYNY